MKNLFISLLACLFLVFPALADEGVNPGDVVGVTMVCKDTDMLFEVADVHSKKGMEAARAHIQANTEQWREACAQLPMALEVQLVETLKEFSGPGGKVIIWKGVANVGGFPTVYLPQIISGKDA